MDRIVLIQNGSNYPICPKCGNDNALLDYPDECEGYYYHCRDCGFEINFENVKRIEYPY